MHAHIHGHDGHDTLFCTYIVHLQSYSSPWLSQSCITRPLSRWPQLQLSSLLVLYLLVFLPLLLLTASASPAPEEVDGVLDRLLYYLLICFYHLFSVFVVHTHPAHTNKFVSFAGYSVAALLLALGRLSAAHTVVNTGNRSPTLAGAHCSP